MKTIKKLIVFILTIGFFNVLIMACGGGGDDNAQGGNTSQILSQSQKEIAETVGSVCIGSYNEQSTDFKRESGVHPIVLVDSAGNINEWTSLAPDDWWPNASSDAELVACIGDQQVQKEVCHYTNGGYIERYSYTLSYTVRVVTTGEYVGQFRAEGDYPKSCPDEIPYVIFDEYWGKPVTFLQIRQTIEEYFFSNPYNCYPYISIDTSVKDPTGCEYDGDNIWIVDNYSSKIDKIDDSGNVIASFESPGTNPGGLANKGNDFFNYDSEDSKLYQINSSGAIIDESTIDSVIINPINHQDMVSVDTIPPLDSPNDNYIYGFSFDGSYLWYIGSSDIHRTDSIYNIYKSDNAGNIVASFACPSGDPSGLAIDGTSLWYADNTDKRIYRLDTAGNIIFSFESPSDFVNSVVYDGNNIITLGSSWKTKPGNYRIDIDLVSELYKIDTNGNIISVLNQGSNGLAFDGKYFWTNSAKRIYKLDSNGNKIINFPAPSESIAYMAFDGNYLWYTTSSVKKFFPIQTAIPFSGYQLKGLTFDGVNLWSVDSYNNMIYEIDVSGKIVKFLNAPGYGSSPSGIAFDGKNFWTADAMIRDIYQIDTLGNVVSSFYAYPGYSNRCLTYDGLYLWSITSNGSSSKIIRFRITE